MRGGLLAIVIAATVAAAGCDEGPLDPSGQPLNVTRFVAADRSPTYSSGYTAAQRLVIRDAAAWQQAWTAIWSNTTPPPPLPAVDFAREMVIVAALGQRPTGGFGIFVDTAVAAGDGARLSIRSVSPGSGCAVTLAVTQPVDAARVSRVDGAVTFEEIAITQQCP